MSRRFDAMLASKARRVSIALAACLLAATSGASAASGSSLSSYNGGQQSFSPTANGKGGNGSNGNGNVDSNSNLGYANAVGDSNVGYGSLGSNNVGSNSNVGYAVSNSNVDNGSAGSNGNAASGSPASSSNVGSGSAGSNSNVGNRSPASSINVGSNSNTGNGDSSASNGNAGNGDSSASNGNAGNGDSSAGNSGNGNGAGANSGGNAANADNASGAGQSANSANSTPTGPVLAAGVVGSSGAPTLLTGPNAGTSAWPLGQSTAPPISASAPRAVIAAISTAAGGSVVGGNVVVTVPPGALTAVAPKNAAISVGVQAAPRNLPVPGGPARYSPNGTVADIAISDSAGKAVTTFAAPITITLKYNAADLAMAGGNPAGLTVAYVIDARSPAIENPLHFPNGTFVFFPSGNVTNDRAKGVLEVHTQALGSVVAVITNPIGYVQTLRPRTPLYSGFDQASSQVFGSDGQFHFLQVVEPQIGSRFLVIDPDTGNYSYVQASDVGPSGSPPGRTSTGVVRALLQM